MVEERVKIPPRAGTVSALRFWNMSDRRHSDRPGPSDRRTFPRPPLWLNLLLLIIAALTFGYARSQRDTIKAQTSILFKPTVNNPAEVNHIRQELSDMDVSSSQLSKELDGRMKYLESVQSEKFYITIDTRTKKLFFRLGPQIVRETDVQIGEAKSIAAPGGKNYTFVPLKGGFNVIGKEMGFPWEVPAWVYLMKGEAIPAQRPTIPNGLGQYVIFLPERCRFPAALFCDHFVDQSYAIEPA